ncbi:S-adenosyl-L-methionine-dependent methyltransferase [Roridomyces roridus]|uniref:S-adenosyl-L-methionine-dependent methyltransferase n=1 Tax=Roridomyces roridus TaxID=1738132 RepID=A0AAD7BYQ8_9AGAR|nr:S-adenosyl-L-methionine-dependent methyltransferase [Roridomyces roridus]
MSPTREAPSASGLTEILTLAELISSSVKDVMAEYTAAGSCLPSLSSTAQGPFDSAESLATRPKLVKAIRTLDAACAQLVFTVGSPEHVMFNKSHAGIQEPTCLLIATDAKIADHLLDKPDGLHADELSRLSGIDSGRLARVLRLLCTRHCFTEVKPNVFANNRLSMKLLSTDSTSSFVGHVADVDGRAFTALNAALKEPTGGSAFMREFGCKLFEFYRLPEQKERATRFNQGMIAYASINGAGLLSQVYPWASLPTDAVVCDVGGGYGHITIDLLKKFPQLKIVVQDLPEVIEEGKKILEASKDFDSSLTGRVQHIPLDFFVESPVEGCDIYHLAHIVHDWPTAECKKILDNIRKVVKPSSRLLINESVMQYAAPQDGDSGDHEKVAPEPLLPNYGMGRVRPYAQDLNMMVLFDAQERTLTEFIEMGETSGFEFVKLWELGETGLLEFKPKA